MGTYKDKKSGRKPRLGIVKEIRNRDKGNCWKTKVRMEVRQNTCINAGVGNVMGNYDNEREAGGTPL